MATTHTDYCAYQVYLGAQDPEANDRTYYKAIKAIAHKE